MSAQHPIFEMLQRAKASLSAPKERLPQATASGGVKSGNDLVSVTGWNACVHTEGEIALYCTISPNDSNNPITGIGLLLNSGGADYGSFYADTSVSGSSTPALNVPPGGLSVGSSVNGMVYGVLSGGEFFSLQASLTVTECPAIT
ncbi:MAG TPA: hypothetical protein VE842_20475 [Pyrinomonadaceae bacterium]|jgi:hypothetical protein|nr:hypothetical protein [Pyrinomonadaceae bacterium]